MGEVYRAHDTKLNRDVALKVVPETFALDPDRLARFTREAQTLAALNHPHIAHIHGLEDAGGVRALVMELVEGEDLAERIARGPIPLDEALPIARQIADALAAAHEQGIVHRDLKPANIKVRADGVVKVLDFGLAKAMDPRSSSSAASALANSPTITSPAAMTAAGIILGTAAYMSPEQARGKVVDKRTDLWAFGCVLYEMIAGLRPFGGDDVTDTIAAVVRAEPEWSKLRADTPTAVRRLLRRCLEKDRTRRLADASDARLEIDEALGPLAGEANMQPAAQLASGAVVAAWPRVLPWAGAGALSVALMLVLWAPWRAAAAPPRVTRMSIAPSGPAAPTIDRNFGDVALSPDGTRIVYIGNNGTQLFVRPLDTLEPVPIATSRSMRAPFFSPDGQWVGFWDGVVMLRKVSITGGPPITLANLDANSSRGATWTPDNTIIFGTTNSATGLQRVSADGGTPEVLTRPDHAQDEGGHFWPEILPGGHAVLFTITSQSGGLDTARVAVRDLRSATQRVLLRGGSHGHYVASGHLVYVAAGALRAIPFDLNRLETHGSAVPVLSRLAAKSTGTADLAVAADGTLVYLDAPPSFTANARTLVWVDRSGKEEPVAAPPRTYVTPRTSPDGTRVALASLDEEHDLWIWDLRRALLTRQTVDAGQDWFPAWTPDGRRIVFSSNRGGNQFNIWWQATDGTGAAERLTTKDHVQQLVDGITPDGKAVVFSEVGLSTMGFDLMQLTLDGTHRVTPLLQTKFDERNGIVSPDGRWLAYESNSSGSFEIFIRPFPNVGGGQWQVSTAGGTRPLWARSGKELFFVGADGTLLRVPVEASGATWDAGPPMKLLERRYYTGDGASGARAYDVSPDGQRFLMIKAPASDAGAVAPALIVVQHWDEELKRLVPKK